MPIQQNISLKAYNTLGIDCNAEYFYEIHNENNLKEAITFCTKQKCPLHIVGLGSNILLPPYLSGLTVLIRYKKYFSQGGTVYIGAGNILSTIITQLSQEQYNLSALTGFPSTIGGAVRGNAGLHGIAIGDFLESATVFDIRTGKKDIWTQKDFQFSYRHSALKECPNKLFWEGAFSFPRQTEDNTSSQKLQLERLSKQPHGRSAGSFFKNPSKDKNNPEGLSAGYFIDQCGLKGMSKGGAIISEKHANFFLNIGNATSQDFLDLIALTKKKVKEKFGISLELEVEVIK